MYSLLTMHWWLYQWTRNDQDIETSEGKFIDSFTITVSPTLYIYMQCINAVLLGIEMNLHVHVGLTVSLIIAIKYYQERMKKREG